MARKHQPFVIAYDFDGTLAPGNMQEYDFVPALNMKPSEFWSEAKTLAQAQQADEILAYMQLMIHRANSARVPIRRDDFLYFGSSINFFPGVEEWFARINAYGKSREVAVQHFIISSGLREMVEGTRIAREFERIYASGFMYDQNGVAHWPALAVNYTTKTQYLFRINKGSLDVHDNSQINKYVPPKDRTVPFTNMVFIGDGETDIPCMRLVKDQGGHSIAVYTRGKSGAKQKAQKLVDDGRTHLAAVADYSEGSAIDTAIKTMIDKVAAQRIIAEAGV
ncbi:MULTISPECIES: HAD family hydrolase [Deefgea]|uniref:Haloacid dehalogenase-like hydrolase n=1 Tax=Deefgea chitinilytica TaxID=570276 RepID=A0ABS2CD87_9NEIS|nr:MULTISPECIES: HAD family hydrolase [Deefgea]MBM5572099.1 haloacid dehalogenase-like hydrolase [Deefgea chitinilytica]MBM9889334.1 haloacid dehalogenase-like hydrolase [Deefgea sp. CFH1-16]